MFDYPSQQLQDWVSQQWVMATGQRYLPADVPWLDGPFGECDVIADHYVDRFAVENDLTIERDAPGAGLVDSAEAFGLDAAPKRRLQPEIAVFYERTTDYQLDVWSQWNPVFGLGGRLVRRLYSRRLRQLDLPQRPLDTARGLVSNLLQLRDRRTGTLRYALWYRRLRATGQVVYSGVYTTCRLPDGRVCVKVAFPLPRGNATVLLAPTVGERGELDLLSSGERFGDPGLYLLLRDGRGRHWAKHVRSFRERITVGVDHQEENVLRADHVLTLWRRQVLQFHYRMIDRQRDRHLQSSASANAIPKASGYSTRPRTPSRLPGTSSMAIQ